MSSYLDPLLVWTGLTARSLYVGLYRALVDRVRAGLSASLKRKTVSPSSFPRFSRHPIRTDLFTSKPPCSPVCRSYSVFSGVFGFSRKPFRNMSKPGCLWEFLLACSASFRPGFLMGKDMGKLDPERYFRG